MKLSQLIKELQYGLEWHGDVKVEVTDVKYFRKTGYPKGSKPIVVFHEDDNGEVVGINILDSKLVKTG